jgi:hypothetical protein
METAPTVPTAETRRTTARTNTTWIYVFEDADDVTPKRAGILASSVQGGVGEVDDTETDGHIVRIEGEVPRQDTEWLLSVTGHVNVCSTNS